MLRKKCLHNGRPHTIDLIVDEKELFDCNLLARCFLDSSRSSGYLVNLLLYFGNEYVAYRYLLLTQSSALYIGA